MDSEFAVNAIIDRARINFLFTKINRFNMQGFRSSPWHQPSQPALPLNIKSPGSVFRTKAAFIKVADRLAESFPYALSYTTAPTDGVCRILRRRHGTA